MEIALPTGDNQDNFSVSRSILSSFQCIIWIALALIAEIPVVVCFFSPLGDIQLTYPKAFLILNLNGVFLYFLCWRISGMGLIALSDLEWKVLGTR